MKPSARIMLALLLPWVLAQPAAAQDSLDQVATGGPDDVLLVANVSFLATNLDNSLRLSRPSNGVEVGDCLLRDMAGNKAAWSASFSDRKRGKALEPLLDVPGSYRSKGVASLNPELATLVQSYFRSGMGLTGGLRVTCDEYSFLRPQGVVQAVYKSRFFLMPASLAAAVSYEIEKQPLVAKDAEAYRLDRYRVIRRFAPSELQQLVSQGETAKQAATDLGSEYSRLASIDAAGWVGAMSLGRFDPLPTVCLVQSPLQRAEAESVYANEWLRKHREIEVARLAAPGDARSQAVARSLSSTQKLGDTRIEKSLNDVFVKMSGSLPCDVFIGSPKDVATLRDGLNRNRPRNFVLGDLREESALLERYAMTEGYARYADILFGRGIGARREQVKALLAQGIPDKAAYDALLDEIGSSGYAKDPGLQQAFAYLSDKAEAGKRGLTVLAERDRRMSADRVAAEQAEARRRAEQQAFDRQYPFEAIVSCGNQSGHLAIIPCFAGESSALNTQLEVRSGKDYGFYQYFELQRAGREVPSEGLKIPLQQPFSLKAQNANASLTLTIKVVEKSSGRVIFIKSAGQFGTITTAY